MVLAKSAVCWEVGNFGTFQVKVLSVERLVSDLASRLSKVRSLPTSYLTLGTLVCH